MKWEACDIEIALLRHLDHTKALIAPNVHFAGGECDVLEITRAGYAVEYEIKVSLADWKADLKKAKWKREARQKISRFYYVIPLELLAHMPEGIPESAGIITVSARWVKRDWHMYGGEVHFEVQEVRRAQRLSPLKVTEGDLRKIHTSLYYRFWDYRRARHDRLLEGLSVQLRAEYEAKTQKQVV